MKKIIVLVMALLLALTFVACDGGADQPAETTGGNGPESSAEQTTGGATDPDDDVTTAGDETTGGSENTDETTGGSSEGSGSTGSGLQDATEVDETVYLTVAGAYYRSAPDVYENNIAGRAAWGDALHRVSYNTEWSVIEIEGTKYYISTECVSKTQPTEEPTFSDKNDKVTVVGSDICLYTAPIATDTTIYVTLEEGVQLTRVKGNESWSIISYESYELYLQVEAHSESEGDADEIEMKECVATLEIKADGTNLYGVASTDTSASEVIATLTKGTQLEAFSVSVDGEWYGVNYLDPTNGIEVGVYVQASAVTVLSIEVETEEPADENVDGGNEGADEDEDPSEEE